MSAPLERWTTAKDLGGPEARAAALFAQVLPPRELSEAVQARHLAVLRGEARPPRRFRLSTPVALAAFFGASMALAATQPSVRQWVRTQLEVAGVLRPAPKPAVPSAVAPLVAPVVDEPVAEEEAVTLEQIDVRVDAGPVVPAGPVAAEPTAPVPTAHPAPRPARPSLPGAAVKPPAPTPTSVPQIAASPAVTSAPAAPDASQPAAKKGLLDTPDIPDLAALQPVERAEVLLKHGELDEAAEILDGMKGDYSDKMTLLRGEVLHARGRCREANVYFTGVIGTQGVADDLLERALYGRAVCHATLGEGAASHADIDTYVSKFPNGRFKSTDAKLHGH